MQRAFLLAAFIVSNLFLRSPSSQAQFQNGGQSSLLRVPLTSQRAEITQRIGVTDAKPEGDRHVGPIPVGVKEQHNVSA